MTAPLGIAGFIPNQLALAIRDDPDIIASIMTGGGNGKDVIDIALDKAEEMMVTAADAGVHDVMYFFYPHSSKASLGSKTMARIRLRQATTMATAIYDVMKTQSSRSLRAAVAAP